MQFWGPATLLKKTPAQVLSCEVVKLFKNIYFEEHLWISTSKLYLQRDSNTDVFLFSSGYTNVWFRNSSVWCLFNKFAKLTAWRPLTVLKDTAAQVFLCEFWEIFRKAFCRAPPRNRFSHDVFFYLIEDQWGVQSKISLFGGAMVN